ncbi:MAG: hypothetical protein H6806_02580 [Planctomycetes bacterium]|nr:hypothetical protein [Planctomycetota bacterium]MCB9828639.1 hypothetical protein [Planctomycetota bacterium]MCB9901000.1 hypothetical protein [Planctomycetota bacterium]
MDNILEDLKSFLADDEVGVSRAAEAELAINDELAKLAERDETVLARTVCARIAYRGSCGFANSGAQAFVVNGYNNRDVKATVRAYWSQGIKSGQFDRVYTIPAGSERALGCTRSGNIPVTSYTFRVVGCVAI